MEVKMRLHELLQEYGLDRHGIKQKIANDLGLDRHTIANIYNQDSATVSLDVLSRLCTWLQSNGVPTDELPSGLFNTGRSNLLQTIAEKKKVTIFLGEGRETQEPAVAYRWISRRDAAAATTLVAQLSHGGKNGYPTPPLDFEYVPFRYPLLNLPQNKEPPMEDMERAKNYFRRMRADSADSAKIIIGSQRVNYLLECHISYLFGCRPFTPLTDRIRVPFYMVWRTGDYWIPSCFGGGANPFCARHANVPGVHCFNGRRWSRYLWEDQKKDAGIIITAYEPRSKAVEIALFGFSGRATEALGKQLILKEHLLWPPSALLRRKQIGIYICKLDFPSKDHTDNIEDPDTDPDCDVIPLSEKILEEYLHWVMID
jgi:transcriptional regulator with XRE-family HTH domain